MLNLIKNVLKTICQQDLKLAELQRELSDANSLRKTQIIELGILREDEKIKLIREKELELENLKLDMELSKKNLLEEIARLKEAHKEEIKTLLFNTNQEKKNLNELAAALEENNKNLKAENLRIFHMNDKSFKEVLNRIEDEKNHVKKPYQSRIMVLVSFGILVLLNHILLSTILFKKLEQEIECLKKSKESVEFQLSMANSDYEHSLTKLKMYYEEKQKGLLPNDIKKVFHSCFLYSKRIKHFLIF